MLPPGSRSLMVCWLTTIGGIVFWFWGIGRLNCGIFNLLDNGGIPHGLVVENGGVFVIDTTLFSGKEVLTIIV